MLKFTGERIVPEADNCEPNFAKRMYQEHIARYMFAAQLCKGKRVLDLGCGIGYGSQFLAQSGAARVVSVDLAEDALAHGRQFYNHPNIEFRQGNAETFEIDEQFDLVVCFEVIEHVHDQSAVMDTIRKALAPNGLLVMSTPRPYEQMRSDFHVHELEEDEFRKLIGTVFQNQEYYFENMHFSSIVADRALDRIEVIKYLNPDLTLSNCDVLMVVASNGSIPKEQLQGVLVVNDDRYVTMLEKDVAILHEAERRSQKKIQDLEALYYAAVKKHDDLFLSSVKREEYEALKRSSLPIEERQRLEAELDLAREEAARLRSELGPVIESLAAQADALAADRALIESLQDQIRAVSNSRSWRVTAPLRALAGLLRGGRPAEPLERPAQAASDPEALRQGLVQLRQRLSD